MEETKVITWGRRSAHCLSAGAASIALAISLAWTPNASAELVITPVFDSSITGNANAAAIEGAINSAIGTIDGLYSNSVNLSVTFTYKPGAAGNLESTNQDYYDVPYAQYVALLTADSVANPGNTVLATAIANLAKGNDANGNKDLAVAGGQLTMLGVASAGNAVININSNQAFDFSRPVAAGDFDAIGGLEHELDEVLGGGGAGSTLNSIASSCPNAPNGSFAIKSDPLTCTVIRGTTPRVLPLPVLLRPTCRSMAAPLPS
jgi:hypothetical protein